MLAPTLYLIAATATVSPEWRLHSSTTATQHKLESSYDVVTETYYSQPIPLKAGHMIFTKPERTPLKMPSGKYAITSFFGDIVDDAHQPVPLSTVYDHHWIAEASNHRNELCHGALQYVFGVGAESRNNPVNLPTGHGYLVEEGTLWGANIHLLRTEGLAGDVHQATKECNECYYAPGKGDQCTARTNGTFACCGEDDYYGVSSCPTSSSGPHPPERSYHLRYRVSYTRNVSAIIPVSVGILSAPNCAIFYGVYRNDEQPVDTKTYEMTIPTDVTVPFAVGHMHTGALNVTLSVNDKLICTSVPTYGTEEGVAGNEKGYLVKVSHCIDEGTGPLILRKGDRLSIAANYYVGSYDSRLLYSDGTHLNVMGYMYVAYIQTDRLAKPLSLPNDAEGVVEAQADNAVTMAKLEPERADVKL